MIAIRTSQVAAMTQAIHYFRNDPKPSVGDTTPIHLDEATLKTPARSPELVLAMILVSTSVVVTVVWTAAMAWSAESLIQGLVAAIGLP
jgi:hypothetical protein